jgi:hypothetical protein
MGTPALLATNLGTRTKEKHMDEGSWQLKWESGPIGGDGPRVKVAIAAGPGYEGDALGFDLLARGIVRIIEEFDTHLLEKGEGHAETLHFYASILSAVARHYMVDADPDLEERDRTVEEVLREMTEVLAQAGMLQETVTAGADNEDEEWHATFGQIDDEDWDDDDWDDDEEWDDEDEA